MELDNIDSCFEGWDDLTKEFKALEVKPNIVMTFTIILIAT